MVAGTLAKAEDVNTNLSGIDSGLDLIEADIGKAIKVTVDAGLLDIVDNAAARANKLLSFDINGDIATTTIMGDWKGNHANAAGTDYQIRDVVSDNIGAISLGSLFICTVTHTSTGSILTDTANWDLLVDATGLTTLGGLPASSYLRSDANDTYTGDLTIAGNILGATAIAGTLSTTAQPNVTSLGALSSLDVTELSDVIGIDVTAANSARTTALVSIALGGGVSAGDALEITHSGSGGSAIDVSGNTTGIAVAMTNSATGIDITVANNAQVGIDVSSSGNGSTWGINSVVTDTDAIAGRFYGNVASRTQSIVEIIQDHATGTVATLLVQQDGTGPSIDLVGTGGIKFPATAVPSTDANTFDDYREGYHTVTATPVGGTITINSAVDQIAYTKTGRKVHVQGQIAIGSVGSPTGSVQWSLPFAASALTENADVVWTTVYITGLTTLNPGLFLAKITAGNAYFTTLEIDNTSIANSEWGAGDLLYISFTYFTDE